MALIVKNKARAIVTINLLQSTRSDNPAHEPETVTLTLSTHAKSGEVSQRLVEKTIPKSISWLPGETLTDVPDDVRNIEQFQQEVAAGRLQVQAG